MEQKDPYEAHKLIYDIIDYGVQIRLETVKLSRVIDSANTLPNSLQALLGMIYRYEGHTQSEISEIYKSDPKNLIKSVKELEKRGLVEKRGTAHKKPLFLTAEGKQVNDDLMKERGELIAYLLENMDLEALEVTRKTLMEMNELFTNYVKEKAQLD